LDPTDEELQRIADFALRCKGEREERGLTIRGLAAELGTSDTGVYHLERIGRTYPDRLPPSLPNLAFTMRIAKYLDVELP
jgi:transcriptional regulator with XRE-family HTH domain